MATQVDLVRVFVASPGDVVDERESLVRIVAEINRTIGARERARLELVRWETDAVPAFAEDPQAVINAQIAPAEIFIAILWNRVGTPTKRASSGTIEEFEKAHASFTSSGLPRLMLYFRNGPARPGKLPQQTESVAAFRERIANLGALFWQYDAAEEFAALAREHLTKALYELLDHLRSGTRPSAPVPPSALQEYQYVIDEYLPACRNLVRLADDLNTGSDHYLALPPDTRETFDSQVSDMRTLITAYNDGWNRLYRQRIEFEDAVVKLSKAPALQGAARRLLNRALDFERGYALPAASSKSSLGLAFRELSAQWRQHRVALSSRLTRAREAADEVEQQLESLSKNVGQRSPSGQPKQLWEAMGLLTDYRDQALRFALAIDAYAQTRFDDPELMLAAAWSLEPCILGMNAAYIALEERSLSLRLALLASGPQGNYWPAAELLGRAEHFQWHEMRPKLNALLANVIALVHGDTSAENLVLLKEQAPEWRELATCLRYGAKRLEPGAWLED